MAESRRKPLPVPGTLLDGSKMRVQELIHGHRFVTDQEPYMILLEALAVCAEKSLGTENCHDGKHEDFKFCFPHRRKMRFLLFRDNHLEQVANDVSIPDGAKWAVWKSRVNRQFNPDYDDQGDQDEFAYLDKEFDGDLRSLRQAVALLRSRTIDIINSRRWTSSFLAVTGPDTICTDMQEKKGGAWSADRRFFGRGGELVYLMLSRSRYAAEVGKLVRSRLLNREAPMNRIAIKLSDPAGADSKAITQIGYLPFKEHPAYNRVAEDWRAILNCNGLPAGHLFEPLFRVTGLNLVVYLAECAQAEIGGETRVPIVADMTDGKNLHLHREAKRSLIRHRDEANRAVETFVQRKLGDHERWNRALELGDIGLAMRAIKDEFRFDDSKFTWNAETPGEVAKEFIEETRTRSNNNAYRYLLPLAAETGVAFRRSGRGHWFALDDGLLFALVAANVESTIELGAFVTRLHERYGIVIGPTEARDAGGRINEEHFEENLVALEARLSRMALTERLSDDCAFVVNPYRDRE